MENERNIWCDVRKSQPFMEDKKETFICEVVLNGYEDTVGLKAIYDCALDFFIPINYESKEKVVKYKILEAI